MGEVYITCPECKRATLSLYDFVCPECFYALVGGDLMPDKLLDEAIVVTLSSAGETSDG